MRSMIDGSEVRNTFLKNAMKLGTLKQTLTTTFTMDADMEPLLFLDPGGAGRTVLLPAETDGAFFFIVNTADAAETLTVKEDANVTTIGTVEQDTLGLFFCNGTTWYDLTVFAEAFLDGVTAGTGAASKAMVLDAGEDFTWPSTGILTYGGTGITANGAEINYLDLVALGTGAASKAVVLDANGAYVGPTASTTKLTWSVTSTSTDGGTSVEPFVHNTTMTGVGGVGGRARFELDTNVALGSWANALKAQLQLGAAGKVTGLGSAFVAELIMEAGAADGTYTPLELELGMPTGALTGTETAFINMTLYGAAASTFDTNGFLFSISGVTKASGKILADTTSGSTIRPVQVLRVKTPDGTRYLPLYSTAAIAA